MTFSLHNQTQSYNTRHAFCFRLLYCRTKLRLFSVSYQDPNFFNLLNSEITSASSFKIFFITIYFFYQLLSEVFCFFLFFVFKTCITISTFNVTVVICEGTLVLISLVFSCSFLAICFPKYGKTYKSGYAICLWRNININKVCKVEPL